MTIVRHIIRFVVAAVVLLLIGYFIPQFNIFGFWNAVLAAIIIAAIGWAAEYLFGDRISPYSRGLVGFITSAIVIWLSQFLVPGMETTFLGAIIAALIIGIVDLFVPIRPEFSPRLQNERESGSAT
jgi:putative membrane protein